MEDSQIKIVFFGTPDFIVPVLEALIKRFQIVGVVTAPDRKVGRKQILTPTPVKSFANAQDDCLTVFTPEKLNEEFVSEMKKLKPDLFIVISYGKIIPKALLEIPRYGVINNHYSLLPKYRGATPMQSAILNGDKTSGITILKMDEKMDHGPIIATEEFSLSDQDTFDSLSKKMTLEAIPLLVQSIPDFVNGKIKPQVQDESMATYCHLITKEDGYFDIENPPSPKKLDRMIRAYYPWPTAWTKWSPSRHPEQSAKDLKIVKFLPGDLVQMEGKKPVKLEDFLRGYPNFPIKNL